MKIAITSDGQNIDANVDPRFGRCAFFQIFELPNKVLSVLANDAGSSMHGAGIAAAQKISQQGVEVVVTGNIGPNAFQVLANANIKVYTVGSIPIKEALDKFEGNQLTQLKSPSGPGHKSMRSGR